jgi:hypothetical protein
MTAKSAPRPAAIAAVLANASKWTHATRKSDGREFWIISGSRPGVVYYTDSRNCTCPDANERQRVCKHSLAVAKHLASKAAPSAPKPAFKSYADLMPACGNGCGDLVERKGAFCWSCESERVYQLDRVARAS